MPMVGWRPPSSASSASLMSDISISMVAILLGFGHRTPSGLTTFHRPDRRDDDGATQRGKPYPTAVDSIVNDPVLQLVIPSTHNAAITRTGMRWPEGGDDDE